MKTKFRILSFILSAIILTQCAKENIVPKPNYTDGLLGRRVRYTIMAVSGDNFAKSEKSLVSATVSIVMNDSVYSVKTDSSGIATFNNLAAGNLNVRISKPDFTTAVYTVDLSLGNDSVTNFDTQNLRNASSIICLFPTSGNGTAEIRGKAFADLDLTLSGFEFVQSGIGISATLLPVSVENFTNHTGGGHILNLYYENASVSGEIQSNGDFSLTVPAASAGLDIILRAEDFAFDQKISATEFHRKIFSFVPDTLKVYPNFVKLKDCVYN
jgi:hypothetical protein